MEDKKRFRKKQLFQDIIKQVEFYFSPSNLYKDRFMMQRFQEHPDGVELTVLLTFNKLKSLTNDLKLLTKALNLSEKLILSPDKSRVKPKNPVVSKENVDECTIYVQHIPLEADHDWLKKQFEIYGFVDYVSLPKFSNGKVKGFAFVEFSSPDEALSAIEDFRKNGYYLSSEMDPENLCSISTYEGNNTVGSQRNAGSFSSDPAIVYEESGIEENTEMHNQCDEVDVKSSEIEDDVKMKRKRESSLSLSDSENKKMKINEVEEQTVVVKTVCESIEIVNLKPVERGDIPEDMDPLDLSAQVGTNGEENVKKRRRKKKKNKVDAKENIITNGLQVLSKLDWKKLRNRYLNMQKEKMRFLKKQLNRNKFHPKTRDSFHHESFDYHRSNNKRKYEADQEVVVENPSTVVKLCLEEPVIDVKSFKSKLKEEAKNVVYIDVKESSMEVCVRFEAASDAVDFASSTSFTGASILSGQEEVEYWKKICLDRTNKNKKKNNAEKKDEMEKVNHDETKISNGSDEKKGKKSIEMKPCEIEKGTVVKVTFSVPVIDVKQFKNEIKTGYSSVKYVDIEESGAEAFIRFENADSADSFTQQSLWPTATIITGEEEDLYFQKIQDDRKEKYEKKIRVKTRGKQKIIKKAEDALRKHIILSEPD